MQTAHRGALTDLEKVDQKRCKAEKQ